MDNYIGRGCSECPLSEVSLSGFGKNMFEESLCFATNREMFTTIPCVVCSASQISYIYSK